eukprot:5472306-Heterocapsa_arctica.AAC.1
MMTLGYGSPTRSFTEMPDDKSPEEEAFIKAALGRNVNLRALLVASEDRLADIARGAERRAMSAS